LTHVAEMPLIIPELVPDVTETMDVEQVEFATKHLEAMAADISDVRTSVAVRRGYAPSEIAELAAEHQAGLIVVPTHGRSGIRHVFWGSVAEKVTRLARCPVLIVRPNAQDLELALADREHES